jgi:lipoate-protein ligase A
MLRSWGRKHATGTAVCLARNGLTLTARSSFSSGTRSSRPRVRWLDLRGSGWSILERLVLEEFLWRHGGNSSSSSSSETPEHWVVCGTHSPGPHRYLRTNRHQKKNRSVSAHVRTKTLTDPLAPDSFFDASWNVDTTQANESAAIVLGISGKPDLLLNLEAVRADRVPVLRRFSGGGTVVLDHQSLWTTMIGRRQQRADNDDDDNSSQNNLAVKDMDPRSIMQYTADALYGPMFERLCDAHNVQQQLAFPTTVSQGKSHSNDRRHPPQLLRTMVLDAKSCGRDNSGRTLSLPRPSSSIHDATQSTASTTTLKSLFSLRENDFCWGEYKIGGNAQSMGQTGWLQHTSLLWDYEPQHMAYLTLPSKRPNYRGDRTHADFLLKLSDIFPLLTPAHVVQALRDTCHDEYELEPATIPQVLSMFQPYGGMQTWFEEKCRTKILTTMV